MRYYTYFECAACCNMYATYTCLSCGEEVKLVDNIYKKASEALNGHNISMQRKFEVNESLSTKSRKYVEKEVNRLKAKMEKYDGRCHFLNKPEYKKCPHCSASQHWMMGTVSTPIVWGILSALSTFISVILFKNDVIFWSIVLAVVSLIFWGVSILSTIDFLIDKKADERNYSLKISFSDIIDCSVKK